MTIKFKMVKNANDIFGSDVNLDPSTSTDVEFLQNTVREYDKLIDNLIDIIDRLGARLKATTDNAYAEKKV